MFDGALESSDSENCKRILDKILLNICKLDLETQSRDGIKDLA